jgi:hypothetical protein
MIGVVSNSSYSSQSNVTIRVGETPMQPASGTASSERLVPITLVVAIGVASGLLLLGAGFCIMWLRRSNRLAGEAGAADDNKGSLQVGRLIDHDGLGWLWRSAASTGVWPLPLIAVPCQLWARCE